MPVIYSNNASTSLSAGINNSTTTIPIASNSGFPSIGSGEYFFATIANTANTKIEIVKVTSGTTSLTVTRGQGGTNAQAFDSGDNFQLRVTADTLLAATQSDVKVTSGTVSADTLIAKGDGSSADGQIQLNCSQNSHGIKLKSPPHSAGASYTLTFPNDDGTNGQKLTTNGSGVLTWTTVDLTALSAAALTSGIVPTARINAGSIANDLINSQHIAADSIDAEHLAPNSVNSDAYIDDSILAAHLAANSVNTDAIIDDAVTSAHLAAGSVDATALGNDVVNSQHIAADSIDAEHYAAGSVDATAIGNDVVNSQHYAAASIDNEHLADNAVGTAEIADDAVTADKLANAINTAIAANTAKNTNATHTGDVTGSGALTIGADKVITSKILNANVTTAKIADDAVTYAKMQHTGTANRLLGAASAGLIGEVQVVVGMMAADSIDSAQYVNGSIDHEHLAADIVDGDIIADDSIDSEHIVADSIDAEHLNANSVNTDAIIDDAVRTAHIQDAQVTVAKMAANSVDSAQYADASIDIEHVSIGAKTEVIAIACGDEGTDLTTGAAKSTFHMPYGYVLTGFKASVTTAPVGSTLTVDLNEAGSTCLTTKCTIDASEKTSGTAATAPVIGGAGPALANNALMTVDIDQIGSSTAGTGLKVYLIGYQS